MPNYQQIAKDNLGTLIGYLGIEAKVEVSGEGKTIKLTVSSDDAGRIIGRKGRTLSAIQLLLNSIMRKDDGFDARIVITIDGYEKNDRRPKQRSRNRNQRNSRREPQPEMAEASAEATVVEPPPQRDDRDADDSRDDRGSRNPRSSRSQRSEPRPQRSEPRRRGSNQGKSEPRPRRPDTSKMSPDELKEFRSKQAQDAAKEVRRWGEAVTLPGMLEEDRKIVLEALQDDPEIEAVEGQVTGPNRRKVTVQLKS